MINPQANLHTNNIDVENPWLSLKNDPTMVGHLLPQGSIWRQAHEIP